MSWELKRFLLNSYGSVAHGRVEELPGHDPFRIDDSKQTAEDSPIFRIYVAVTGVDQFLLHLVNLAMDDDIERLVRSKGGNVTSEYPHSHIKITLDCTDCAFVLQLSELILDLGAWGEVDSEQNHALNYTRAAESLRRFGGLLKQYTVQTRGMEKTRPDGLFAY